ncbi:hypothetical protein CLHUN_40350 [Ruminiclostridium hungatei]|uniref:Uncharacterized protein n=1 Tax=Ruminiclostridium hungatei TaxID=48256 RepID=A0A1V4SDY8_RUMHU|nr:hypothetical protein [Ruminiclostridium hungatei]OPX42129.1 hypothetical protein CLHUN_40350 [Ruminiclostridium hungatei]
MNIKNYIIETSKDNKYGTCGTMIYSDSKCRIEFDVCDYRDPVWWITILKKFKLSKEQKIELLRRISADVKMRVYEELIGEIQENINNIDGSKSIMDY